MSDQTPPTQALPQQPERPPQFVDAARRYRLDSRIATGGMGEVWRGTDTALDRVVAVKLLKSEYADDATFRSRFEDEARHAAALHHPGVCAVYDVGESPATDGSGVPRPFLVMELVDGQPLSALLSGGRKLDPVPMRELLAQAADAIGAAHAAGIVHRDVKPANLMVTPDRRIKITDFGIARASDGLGLTGTGQVMGTPQYLSPEQARGNPATAASDVYALGVVAWECLSGYRPFDKGTPVATALAHLNEPVPALAADVPRDLAVVVERALAKDPADRYADGAELAAALRDPATAATQVVPGFSGGPGAVAGGAALGAGAALAGGAAAYAGPDEHATEVMRGVAPPPDTPAEPMRLAPTPGQPGGPRDRRDERAGLHPGWIAAAVIALAVIGLLLYTQLRDTGADEPVAPTPSATPTPTPTPEPTQEPTPTPEPEPETINLDEGDYLDRDVDEVLTDLRNLGLDPSSQVLENPGGEDPETVVSVSPTQDLEEGSSVEVTYYGDEPEPEPSQEPTDDPSAEPEPSDEASSSSPADPSPADPSGSPSATDGPGNSGNSSGSGNGNGSGGNGSGRSNGNGGGR